MDEVRSARGPGVSRRGLLSVAALGTLAATLPLAGSRGRAGAVGAIPGRAAFDDLVGSVFTVHTGALERVEVRLVSVSGAEVADSAAVLARRAKGAYSLLFEGPARRAFKQGTYRIEHPMTDPQHLFLVPVLRPTRVQTYEAVINRS